MSVRTMSRVWEHSQHAGSDLLMLLAIADFSDDDGRAFPAVATLATKCRMKMRNCQYILRSLELSGELSILANQGPHGANLYRINLNSLGVQHLAGVQGIAGVQHSAPGGAKRCAEGVQPIAPKPSVNHQETSTKSGARSLRGSRLKADWILPDQYLQWANENLGWTSTHAHEVAERFRDYWISASGNAASKNDWFATWRNWCRNERTPSPGRAATMTQHQQNQAAIAASLFGPQLRGPLGQSAKLIEGEVIHGN